MAAAYVHTIKRWGPDRVAGFSPIPAMSMVSHASGARFMMADAPLGFQLHALVAFGLFALWPFTRLVHVFSAPVGYLTRPYIVYRSRDVQFGQPHPAARLVGERPALLVDPPVGRDGTRREFEARSAVDVCG